MLRKQNRAEMLVVVGVVPVAYCNLRLGELEVLKLSELCYSVVLSSGNGDIGGSDVTKGHILTTFCEAGGIEVANLCPP